MLSKRHDNDEDDEEESNSSSNEPIMQSTQPLHCIQPLSQQRHQQQRIPTQSPSGSVCSASSNQDRNMGSSGNPPSEINQDIDLNANALDMRASESSSPHADESSPRPQKLALPTCLTQFDYLHCLLLLNSLCKHFGLDVELTLLINNVIARCDKSNYRARNMQVCIRKTLLKSSSALEGNE